MFTGGSNANVRVHIRRGIVQVQRERPIIRRIVPIATADGRANERLDSINGQHIIKYIHANIRFVCPSYAVC